MSTSRKPLVAGNWKMNGSVKLLELFSEHFEQLALDGCDAVLCPPAVFLSHAVGCKEKAGWLVAGQDVSHCEEGAHTGDISANMLDAIGCDFVIVGHSERRVDHLESNELIADKTLGLISKGLTPIFCVGESLETRNQGKAQEFVAAQLAALFAVTKVEQLENLVIAYEPIWAIGTGVTASPEQAQEMHSFIRDLLSQQDSSMSEKVRLLYGGSVKPANADELFSQKDIDGGLIGGASLKPEEFEAICRSACG